MDTLNCPLKTSTRVIDFFQLRLINPQNSKMPPQKGDLETLRRIDDWWFVPRGDDAVRQAHTRLKIVYETYRKSKTLPKYAFEAYVYAQSSEYKDVEWFWNTRTLSPL